MKAADNFLKLVEWSKEDQCYVGSSPGLIGPCCHGKDEAQVYKKLCKVIEEWVDIYKRDGHPLPEFFSDKAFSGKFVLRVGEDLHKALAIQATKCGESLNSYCANRLRNTLLTQDSIEGLRGEIAKGWDDAASPNSVQDIINKRRKSKKS